MEGKPGSELEVAECVLKLQVVVCAVLASGAER
jgi:hypothetical protein